MKRPRKTPRTASEYKLTSDAARAELTALVMNNAGLDEIVACFGKYGITISTMSASRVFDRVQAAADRLLKRNASLEVIRKDADKRGITLTQAALEQGAIAVGDIIDGSAAPETEEGQKLLLDGVSVLTGVRIAELRDAEGKGRMAVKKAEIAISREKLEIETCKKFLEWFKDARAKQIAESNATNSEKIAALRQTYFADVEAFEKSGKLKLPK